MTDATTVAAPVNALDTFFAHLSADWQVVEADVISVCQNIKAGVEVAAEDLQYSLSWLGSHIGQIAQTVNAVQASVTAITAAGVPIPASLASGLNSLNQAVAGVNEALSNQAISASASAALSNGYSAAKALQVAAASAAAIAAAVGSTTSPATASS